jgi:hypothetical protein
MSCRLRSSPLLSSHHISALLSGSALYQYLLDIPDVCRHSIRSLLPPHLHKVIFRYVPEIVESATTIASLFMTEEMCLILGTLLSDSLKFFLRYSSPDTLTVATVNKVTAQSLEAMLGLLRYCHRTHAAGAATEREQTQVIQVGRRAESGRL